jgi:hypothetical protein
MPDAVVVMTENYRADRPGHEAVEKRRERRQGAGISVRFWNVDLAENDRRHEAVR